MTDSNAALSNPATWLRALILAMSFWLVSLSLTVLSGSVAAVSGCILACLLADTRLDRAPLQALRLTTLLAGAGLLALGASLLAGLLTGSPVIASLLSPIGAFNSGEAVLWFGMALALSFSLRSLARRTGWGGVAEIIAVASAIVWVLAAHRNGMIHRPFLIGDFALIRGIDPSTILMAFGCVAVLALAALLMIEQNRRRLPYHFAVLGVLCLSLVGYVRLFGLPTPQLTNDMGLTGQEQTGRSTANDNPFRDGENNQQDREAPVAVVVFRDDYEPLNGAYYFRESAYSQFNGTMLDYASRTDMDRDLIENFTASRTETNEPPGAPDQRKPVRTTVGMLVPHRNPFGLTEPVAYENRPNPNNLRFKRAYDVLSQAPEYDYNLLFGRELGRADWSEEVRQEYLRMPNDARYGELARRLTADIPAQYADDPFAKIWTIKTYLDENGIYSLKNEHAYATDPAASFLFGDLTGYCMHFSFAATYLYRSLGIPARVGVGYSVPASNRAGGSALLVQAIHAHAWPEIYFRDIGWVIVDPAPQRTLVDMSTDPQNDLQQLLGDMLRDEAAFNDFLETQQTSFLDFLNIRSIINSLLALLAAAVVSGYLVKGYRQWVPASPVARDRKTQSRLNYRAALDHLAALGLSRRVGESREQFAARVSAVAPSLSPMTQAHLATALGSASPPLEPERWRALRRTLAEDLKQNTDTWRRLVGLLNPFSWLLTR